MNQREKILESIKKGILSPEEGLDLLEALGLTEEAEPEPEETAETKENDLSEEPEPVHESAEAEFKSAEDVETTEVPEAEPNLNEEFHSEESMEEPESDLEPSIEPEALKEEAPEKTEPVDSVASMIDEWEGSGNSATDEVDPVESKIDEFDQALQTKKEILREKKEVFRELNLEAELGIISEENKTIYHQMEGELKELEEEVELLKHERLAMDQDFFTSMESPHVSDSFFEVPDDFEEQTYRPVDRPHEEPNDWASRIARMVTKASKTVTETVNSDLDWKEVNRKFKGVGNTKFSYSFDFEEIGARTIDIKVAKGEVILKTWEDESIEDVKIDASITLLGQMKEAEPLDAFLERSYIDVTDRQIQFHVPNKRIDARLTFYLPKRQYNTLTVRLLTGELVIDDLITKNGFIKVTNGSILIKKIQASMIEIEGTNNEIELRDGQISDIEIQAVTGTIVSKAAIEKAEYALINGDVKISAGNYNLQKIEAGSVNGDVKLALPKELGFDGSAKTGTGLINYRLADCETMQERNGQTQKRLRFKRRGEANAHIRVSSKTGNIFLKDYDK